MALPVGDVLDAIDIFFDYMFTGSESVDADGHTLGQVSIVYGTYYYRHADLSTTTERGRISFNTTVAFRDSFLMNCPGVNLYWEGNPTSNAYLATNSNAVYVIRPGNTITHLVLGSTDNNIDNREIAIYWGSIPTLVENQTVKWSTSPFYLMGSPDLVTNVNDGNVSQFNSHKRSSLVVPIEPNEVYTYNEAVNIIIPFLHENGYPDVTADDLPQFDEINPTEPTEPPATSPGGCCDFTIDYNEILSPSELESVLNETDYELAEVPTMSDTLNLPELPSETLPPSVLAIAGTAMRSSYDFYMATGLAGVMVATAVIVCLIRMLRGD